MTKAKREAMHMSDDELPGIMSDDECELVLAVLQKVNLVVRLHASDVLTRHKPLTPTQRGMLKAHVRVIKYIRSEIKCMASRFGKDTSHFLFDPVGTKLFSAGKQAEVSDGRP